MKYKVIDNFLDFENFQLLKKELKNIPFYYTYSVSSPVDFKNNLYDDELWNWYHTHMVYNHIPYSDRYSVINDIFWSKFIEISSIKTWIRIKINSYPYTSNVKEHPKHTDYDYNHQAAIFTINSCNGFTRMSNGDKIESIENRLLLFDASDSHNSSTTSNCKYRMNINFNWI